MAMFEDADPFNRGTITYEALKGQLEKHGGLLENLSIRYSTVISPRRWSEEYLILFPISFVEIFSIDRWLVPLPLETTKKAVTIQSRMPHQLTAPYLKNNYVFLTFLSLFVAVNVGLFVSRAFQYRDSNVFVIIARACGKSKHARCWASRNSLIEFCSPRQVSA